VTGDSPAYTKSSIMLSRPSSSRLLQPVGPIQLQDRIQNELKNPFRKEAVEAVKSLSPHDAQKFLNFLGSRCRMMGRKLYRNEFGTDEARAAFKVKADLEVVHRPIHFVVHES
jgi:hypothetical protein